MNMRPWLAGTAIVTLFTMTGCGAANNTANGGNAVNAVGNTVGNVANATGNAVGNTTNAVGNVTGNAANAAGNNTTP